MPVYTRCALLGNDAIGDEIYADKCKVALTNVVESILAHLLVALHVQYTDTHSVREREMERCGKESNDCLFFSVCNCVRIEQRD